MAIPGKDTAIYFKNCCIIFVVLDILNIPGTILVYSGLKEEQKLFFIGILVIGVIDAGLRCYLIIQLNTAFAQDETNPQEALNTMMTARNVMYGIVIVHIPLVVGAVIQGLYICCCIGDYITGLQNEVNQRQMMGGQMPMMMSPSGNPMMIMSPSGQQGPPWPASSNVVYPSPAYNVPNNQYAPQYP